MPAGRPKLYVREEIENFNNIPEELKQTPNWVCWKSVPRENDKPAKVPVTPGIGRHPAQVNDPQTWRPFKEAVAVFKRYDQPIANEILLGIGFVFSASDPFTGIDVDDCRDPATGQLSDKALHLLEVFNSYAEISPSGTGIKIFIKGNAPGNRQRRGGIEIYSQAHYFTVTGRHIPGTPKTIEARQGQLADLYQEIFGKSKEIAPAPTIIADPSLERVRAISDDDLISQALRQRRFKKLWDGGSNEFPSHSEADFALCCQLAYWTCGDRERIDKLFRRSGLMREKWEQKSAGSTYGWNTIDKAIESEPKRFDPDAGSIEPTVKNDNFNAQIFVDTCGSNFVFVPEWNEWLRWCGTHWQRNAKDELQATAVEQVSKELLRRAYRLPPDMQAKEINWAVKTGNTGAAASVESLCRFHLATKPDKFDTQTMLLACANGVIDLATSELRPGKPEDYLTRASPVEYIPKAKCPRFDKFLLEIMEGDKEWVAYLWRVLGYCLTGEVREHVFFMLHGDGLNGKSTFIDVLNAMMGDMAQSARFQTFLSKGKINSGANDDIAHMVGARVVVALEADEASKLDSALVKNLTGADRVRARYLYSPEFEFKPRLKLFLVSNYVPRIDDQSNAIWRRVHYIPFKYKVPENKIDQGLALKLYGELEGIFAKAVTAAKDWNENGLQFPAKGKEETAALRQEFDVLGAAMSELAVEGQVAHAKISQKDLLREIRYWFESNNYRYPPRTHELIKYLRRHGYQDKRGAGNMLYWHGLQLRDKPKAPATETMDMEL